VGLRTSETNVRISVGPAVSVVVSDVSAPAYTNGVLPPMAPLRLISVAKKKRSLTMLSFVVQHIDLPMECMA